MSRKQQLKNSEYHLSPAAIKKVVHAVEGFRDRCILKTLAQTAIRRSELTELDVRDIDFERKLIQIQEGKGGKGRTIPVSADLLSDLRHLLGRRTNGPVFVSLKGGSLTPRQIGNIVARAGERAGVENPNPKYNHLTPHLFRHSFAREWKKKGGSIESLSKILGHTSVKTTLDEYGTEDLEEVQANYERVMTEMF